MQSSAVIHTANIPDRRTLRFESLDEVLDDVDRLVEAERALRLKRLGNWKLGQTLGHLAAWAEYSYTGAPIKAPFLIRCLLRLRKKRFLHGPMRAGVRIPRVPGGTLGTDPMPVDEAADRYRRILQRLKVEPPTAPNVIFGPLTHQEWILLNLRHAELHLSFLVPV